MQEKAKEAVMNRFFSFMYVILSGPTTKDLQFQK